MKTNIKLLSLTCVLGLLTACNKDDSFDPYRPHPDIDPDHFVTEIDNPYFPLKPGTTYYYVNTSVEEGDTTLEKITVKVTHDAKVIQGVTCRVVHDVAKDEDGKVIEDTYDWYAQDKKGNVWYFGEDTKAYEDGKVSTEGSWQAGVDGAKAGIIMYAKPMEHVGEPYYQEYLKGEAEDQAEVLGNNSSVSVAYGSFSNCLKTKEFTALEPGVVENKYYAKGVGMVLAETAKGGNEREELVRITQ